MPERRGRCFGWDIGGAHVKACRVEDGTPVDVVQWPCPLWEGLGRLDAVLAAARERWPLAWAPGAMHIATMTGEMVDLFPDREQGVRRIAAHLAEALGPTLRLYAGDAGWVAPPAAGGHWRAIASANWRATASWLAPRCGDAVLVDVGSTTTDLIALRGGRVAARGASDAERLASGELVYQGVVRTPLCALGPRVPFGGEEVNVMNEFFATTADIYRLTGELDAAHDQHPAADRGAKDDAATRQRLARMIGHDAADAPPSRWLALARTWRARQLAEIGGQLERVVARAGLDARCPLVGAGCGAFLAAALAAHGARPYRRLAHVVAGDGGDQTLACWIDVCAPAVAVALLAPPLAGG
jgi:probable H4MPT-linked C1 transfer pathway protein